MSYNTAVKSFAVVGDPEIIFSVEPGPEGLVPDHPHSFIDVVSLDAIDGNPVEPGAGNYLLYVESAPNAGFQSISDGGTLDATKTGGTATTDGTVLGASFNGPVNRVKVKVSGVTTATHARVKITQNLT